MARILITRPEHDPLTNCLSHWNAEVIKHARSKGNDVVDLHKNRANRKEFEGCMKKLAPVLVLLNGHGDETSVAGHDNEILVKAGENEFLLKNKITYAVACSSAKILGVVCADKNTTFIGYDKYFILNLDRHFLTRPLDDKRAQRFLEPSNKVANSLIKGHTCQEASDNSKQEFQKNIKMLLKNIRNSDDIDDVKDLFWNMNHQVCLGDTDAKI